MFGSERSTKLVRKWLRLKPQEIKPVFCAINHGRCEDRAICDRNVNDIIKRGVVKVKRCARPSDLEVSGHSLRVGAAQDLLIRGYDLAAIMRAGGWSDASTVSRYLRSCNILCSVNRYNRYCNCYHDWWYQRMQPQRKSKTAVCSNCSYYKSRCRIYCRT